MYLPILINTDKLHVLIIGGGMIAYRKAKKIIEAKGKVTCVSRDFCEAITKLVPILCIQDNYNKQYLRDADLVIAATNNNQINEEIYKDCAIQEIPCLRVDSSTQSDFIFPATRYHDDIMIDVSTYGRHPAMAKEIANDLLAYYEQRKKEGYYDSKSRNKRQ